MEFSVPIPCLQQCNVLDYKFSARVWAVQCCFSWIIQSEELFLLLLSRGGQVFICARELLPSILLLRFGQLGSGGLLCYGAMQIRIGNKRIFILEFLSLLFCYTVFHGGVFSTHPTDYKWTHSKCKLETCPYWTKTCGVGLALTLDKNFKFSKVLLFPKFKHN